MNSVIGPSLDAQENIKYLSARIRQLVRIFDADAPETAAAAAIALVSALGVGLGTDTATEMR